MADELVERNLQILFKDLRPFSIHEVGSLRIGMDEVRAILSLEARITADAAEIARLRAEVEHARELVRVATETTQKHLRGLCDAEDRAADARAKALADVAVWLTDSAIKDADDLRQLHAGKKLTPMMTKEWETLIQTKVGISTALETGEWEK